VAYETAALRNFDPANVADGSSTDVATPGPEVGFSPNNGHYSAGSVCPFRAINEHIKCC
jgi:hypothetical protein